MSRYAANTTVASERSRGEIERTLTRYGADQFAYGWDGDRALIRFRAHERFVQFVLPLPARDDPEITTFKRGQYGSIQRRSQTEIEKRYEQATRQKWRALALIVKAKLEAVESGIFTFEQEFLAHTMLPNGTTFGEWAAPELQRVYDSGEMPKRLLALPAGDPA